MPPVLSVPDYENKQFFDTINQWVYYGGSPTVACLLIPGGGALGSYLTGMCGSNSEGKITTLTGT